MEEDTFSIPNISCGHCTKAIENELSEKEGVVSVAGDIANKSVTVKWESPTTRESIVATLKDINYPAAE
jgi:copper chaperone CopZ